MNANVRAFELDLQREWDATLDELRDAVSILALQALRELVQRSPVDTGRFKGNWSLSVGSRAIGTRETVDPSGGATIAAGADVITAYAAQEGFPAIYITNNLPYAQRLEDGWSGQAPAGIVGVSIPALQAYWNSIRL